MASLPAPDAGATCAVSGDPETATHMLLQGDILGEGRSYLSGDVLVELGVNGTIECVGCGCEAAAPAELLQVSCPDAVVSPELINSHDHIRYSRESPDDWGDERFDHRHDWRTGARGHTALHAFSTSTQEAILYGELRMLLGGATSIAGSVSSTKATGLIRNLDNADDNEGLGGWEVDYSTFPLGDLDGDLSASGCGGYFAESIFVLSSRIYLPHISEGIDLEANNEFRCLAGLEPDGTDLIEDNTSIVHGIGLTADDIALVSDEGRPSGVVPPLERVVVRRDRPGGPVRQPGRAHRPGHRLDALGVGHHAPRAAVRRQPQRRPLRQSLQ